MKWRFVRYIISGVFLGCCLLSGIAQGAQNGQAAKSALNLLQQPGQHITFAGLNESGITINNFMCSSRDAASSSDCFDAFTTGAIGFDISGGKTLQFFNNFVYWIGKKYEKEQYYESIGYTAGSDLDNYATSQGWGVTSLYCIIVSTDPIMQKAVWPTLAVVPGGVKVVVQLWYCGSNMVQLWSQDAIYVNPGQSFTIAVSNASDDRLAQTLAAVNKTDPFAKFLAGIGLQSSINTTDVNAVGSRQNSDYTNGGSSPRQVRLVVG